MKKSLPTVARVSTAKKSAKSKDETPAEIATPIEPIVEKEFDSLELIESILLRPDTYIGSITKTTRQTFMVAAKEVVEGELEVKPETDALDDILDDEDLPSVSSRSSKKPTIVMERVDLVMGLIHIYSEIISNAMDNCFSNQIQTPTTKIWIEVDPTTGWTSIKNNGTGIPIKMFEKKGEKMWIPEMVFSKLISGSNFKDSHKRYTSGRNGYGAKLTNVFSKEFNVETIDKSRKLKFTQHHYNNMHERDEPVIATISEKEANNEYTKISWMPDFERFGVEGYDDTHVRKMHMLAYQAAMITGATIYFNDEKIVVKSLEHYVKLIHPEHNMIGLKSTDSQVVIVENDLFEDEDKFEHVSFVNGIATTDGGVHVEEWSEAVFKDLLVMVNDTLAKASDKLKLKITDLKSSFKLYINCMLINPTFESQTKLKLSSPKPTVKSLDKTVLKKVLEWPFMERMKMRVEQKQTTLLKSTDGKRNSHKSIPKLDDANFAGLSAKADNCRLFLTEGDSAKSFIVQGMTKIEGGRDCNGVFPLRGKLLNVTKANIEKFSANVEINHIMNILGLKHGIDYTDEKNFKTLRYRKGVVIAADQDVDGLHIAALIINFFYRYFPSILSRPYLYLMWTPIVRIPLDKKSKMDFYRLEDANDYIKQMESEGKKVKKPEYNKGLGGFDKDEIVEYFAKPKYILVDGENREDCLKALSLAFATASVTERKKWIENYYETKREKIVIDDKMSIHDFINRELIQFSVYANYRSIPSWDGLKPSQRKILFGAMAEKGEDMTVVSQISANAAKVSHYHHGTEMLANTLVKMGASYPGSNNIPYFTTKGNFGTRMSPDDASAPRYLKAKLNKIIEHIFLKDDECILKYSENEGEKCEPEMYYPIIPMGLVNGSEGIGTGYSCHYPMFNPKDLIKWIRWWLSQDGEELDKSTMPELVPWYRGYKGHCQMVGGRVTTTGLYSVVKGLVHVKELPIGKTLDGYKLELDAMCGIDKGEKKKTGVTRKETAVKSKKGEDDNESLVTEGTKSTIRSRASRSSQSKLITGYKRMGDETDFTFVVEPLVHTLDVNNLKLVTQYYPLYTVIDVDSRPKVFKDLIDYLCTYCSIRLEAYTTRKAVLLPVYKKEYTKLKEKHRFINEFMSDPSQLFHKTDEEISDVLTKKNYSKIDDKFDYLTDTKLSAFTKENLQRLQTMVDNSQERLQKLKVATPTTMWLSDLEVLEKKL
jgi:DNA topoisomerase II